MRLEVRNLRAADIRRETAAALHGREEDGAVAGPGWRVRFHDGQPARVGALAVPVLFLEIEGEREAEVAAFLRLHTMRGGG